MVKNLSDQKQALSIEGELHGGREFGHYILVTDTSQILGVVLAAWQTLND